MPRSWLDLVVSLGEARSFAGAAALSLLLLAGTSGKTYADYVYTLSTENTGGGGLSPTYPGPYCTVTVHLTDSTHAVITFAAGASSLYTYKFGGSSAFHINVNATTWSIGGLSPGSLNNGGAQHSLCQFGDFSQTVHITSGAAHAITSGSFTLTNTGGMWASDSTVLTPNAAGFAVAAHIVIFDALGANPATGFGVAGTGFAGTGSGAEFSNPEPATVITLLSGIPFGLIALLRRFRRRRGGSA